MHSAGIGAALFSITLCFPASAQVIDVCVKNDGSEFPEQVKGVEPLSLGAVWYAGLIEEIIDSLPSR